MNPELLSTEAQDFINANQHRDINELLLKKSPINNIGINELCEQIYGKQRTRTKLPEWHGTPGIYYPPALALEQCSSANTGAYKASLCSGDTLVDLTGGAGVDSYFFAKRFRRVIHIERDAHLSAVAAYNLPLLGATNVRFVNGDGMEFISGGDVDTDKLDCIYLDPSRRAAGNRKVFRPEDYEPDFIPRLAQLISRTRRVIIKTSPLVDIKFGISAFSYVQSIHVVAVMNECKELIWILGKRPVADPSVDCVNITGEEIISFKFSIKEEEEAPAAALSPPLQYLYEPGAAILKGGAFKTLARRLNLSKLHANSHLYTSPRPLGQFPGRSFFVRERFSPRQFGKLFKGRRMHIATRNFPETTASIRKKYGIGEGGNDYAFFTRLADGKRVVLLCEKQSTHEQRTV